MSTKVAQDADIKGRIKELRDEFENVRKQMEAVEKKGRILWRKIEDLQATCPHTETKKDFVSDGAELKLCRICQDCGKVI